MKKIVLVILSLVIFTGLVFGEGKEKTQMEKENEVYIITKAKADVCFSHQR